MSAKHTSGEWVVGDAPDSRVAVYAGNACIAVVGEQGYPVIDADARLIAAAPELLDMLEQMIAGADEVKECWEDGNLAGAVTALRSIANEARRVAEKAKGEL